MSAVDFLTTPARQRATLSDTAHRPWPLPRGAWLMAQTWERLLFAHWRVPVAQVRPRVPAELAVDEFDGTAWVGITPFRLSGLRLHSAPPVPAFSSFLELNVRTYVMAGGKPGIWFFSLDAESRIAVAVARRAYRLPYFHAAMSERVDGVGGAIRFSSRRLGDRGAYLDVAYGPCGPAAPPEPGTLEHFLTERYCHYAYDEGRLYYAEIHHPPWPLRPATGRIELNTMPPPGLELRGESLLHLADRQDVLIWKLERFAKG